MAEPPSETCKQTGSLNWWLGFPADVSARYERETAAERVAHIRRTAVIGLIFYNAYNSTHALLMPETLLLGLLLRLGLVTLGTLCIVWVVPRLESGPREALITAGTINAIAVPIYLFWLTREPFGNYSFGELPLTEVFGGMMLVLRFPCTLVFLACTLAMEITACILKQDLPHRLVTAFCLQSVTSAAFVLYSNYMTERARRTAYLRALRDSLHAEKLETDRQRFSEMSSSDPLTGLGNRRILDATLAKWSSDNSFPARSHAVIMIDVDHFKAFNDVYGHQVGDDCLHKVAGAICSALRTGDVAVRYGGEEFAALLTGCEPDAAEYIAERLCRAIEALAIPHCNRCDGLGIVTISAGVAHGIVCQLHTSLSFVAAADEALYEAKRSGRNRFRTRRVQEAA